MEPEVTRQVLAKAFGEAIVDEGFAPPGYEVLRELDRGGMAVVYEARQLSPPREVALKVVLPKFAGEGEIRERFQREGRAMAALESPGVLPIYEVGEWDGLSFLTMKLARGGTLHERLEKGLTTNREAVDWLIAAGEAVHFAHQRGVLHRDLKPGNLLFDEAGGIYVGDFGVAKLEYAGDGGLTRTEALIGTPNYLAPEVASGANGGGSVAADLYGLGAVLYECLTGRRPHEGCENLAAQLRAVVDDEVLPVRKMKVEVPQDLAVICEKALAKNPDERYGSVNQFVEDLKRWREGREILARPASVREKVWKSAKRHPLTAVLFMLLFLLLAGGGVLFVDNYYRRGLLLRESYLERARGERLLGEPGFRERALGLLKEANGIGNSPRIREEAVAVLANWDVGGEDIDWAWSAGEAPYLVQVMEGGLELVSRTGRESVWSLKGGVLRCEPAVSRDGRFLAVICGEQMEVVIYDVFRRQIFSRLAVQGWPRELLFGDEEEWLRVVFEDGSALLANVRGEVLLDNFSENEPLQKPVGFHVWKGQYFSPVETVPYGGRLSKDGEILVTTSVTGVQIWDVRGRKSVAYHAAENQRIDAPTDAWWIGKRTLLLQVPGALEILKLDEEGQLLAVQEIARVPGTRVEQVRDNGDWIVEVRDEDEGITREIWPTGDSGQARDLSAEEFPLEKEAGRGGTRVRYGEWVLTLPDSGVLHQVFVLPDKERVIALTEDYLVCDWDLKVLEKELKKRDF